MDTTPLFVTSGLRHRNDNSVAATVFTQELDVTFGHHAAIH